MNSTQLVYVYDPMCSWCWAFDDVLNQLLERLPETLEVNKLLGGLAADSDQPMSLDMQKNLQLNWRNIEKKVPHKRFNFNFWTQCSPRRSTYPACRAVLAAQSLAVNSAMSMTASIQQAYYQRALNPSNEEVLSQLAGEIGLSVDDFEMALSSDKIQQQLKSEIAQSREMGVDSFPALVLLVDTSRWRIPVDYLNVEPMLDMIDMLLE